MQEGGHDLEEVRGVLRVRLRGNFEKENGEAFLTELTSFLDSNPTIRRVLIDLRPLVACSVFARSELLRAQRLLLERRCRTAYLADRSRFRGLGLWVAHLADDPEARSVMTEQQASEWLTGSLKREASARADLVERRRR